MNYIFENFKTHFFIEFYYYASKIYGTKTAEDFFWRNTVYLTDANQWQWKLKEILITDVLILHQNVSQK